MGSSNKKKKSSREDSINFDIPRFSDFDALLAQNSQQVSQDSNHSWMNQYLTPALTSETRAEKSNTPRSEAPVSDISFKLLKRCVRDPTFDIKDAGTGHHDNRLTKNPPGQFREPSLRRGYGMAYEPPRVFDNVPTKGASQIACNNSQTMESLPETETQSSISAPRGSLPNSQHPPTTNNNDGSNMVSYDIYTCIVLRMY
jgi:hypothetical protein